VYLGNVGGISTRTPIAEVQYTSNRPRGIQGER